MLKAGIVGLPNVGKSTLFNALVANAQAQAANFPFCTIEPNVGKVAVPDLHATALHCLGIDHEDLTFRFQGRDFRLTDVAGRVIPELVV